MAIHWSLDEKYQPMDDTVADVLEEVQWILDHVVDASRVALVENNHSSRITLDGKTICSVWYGGKVRRFAVGRWATQQRGNVISDSADIVDYKSAIRKTASEIVPSEEWDWED